MFACFETHIKSGLYLSNGTSIRKEVLINSGLWESSSDSQTHCGLIKSGKHFHCATSCKPVDENLFVEKENVLQDQNLQVGVWKFPKWWQRVKMFTLRWRQKNLPDVFDTLGLFLLFEYRYIYIIDLTLKCDDSVMIPVAGAWRKTGAPGEQRTAGQEGKNAAHLRLSSQAWVLTNRETKANEPIPVPFDNKSLYFSCRYSY